MNDTVSIERLTAEDCTEWLEFLNCVFSIQNKRKMDFREELPKMCVEDDYHMGMHLAVKGNGKIRALLGVYPLKTRIGNKELTFSTVGNVATLPEYEGRGYMKVLMDEAMKELDRIGADASRLGGVRQRYNRYGYEACGIGYTFKIDSFTTKYCFDGKEKVLFREITLSDKKELAFINEIRKNKAMYVQRSSDGSFFGDFASLCAWKNKPYIATDKDGNMVGYVSATKDGKTIAELAGNDFITIKNIIYNWQKDVGEEITFTIPAADYEVVKYFSEVAEEMTVSSPCHFKIINFDKVADALIKLKASHTPGLPEGERVIGIKDWGNLLICHKNDEAYCEKTDKEAAISLDRLKASRLLFGPFPANSVTECDAFLNSVLPLPLSWSTLDRV